MVKENFQKRKQDILSKRDKSSKQSWDKKIFGLCEKINKKENYYTTSSCSGRIVIMFDKEKKENNLFIKVYHDKISLKKLKNELGRIGSLITRASNGLKPTLSGFSLRNKLRDNDKLAKKSAGRDFGANELIKFKQEPCILHIACASLKDAQNLLDKAKLAGWKRSGIIASGKRFICELNGTEKLEFPLINDGEILVKDNFLKLIVEKSNKNLEKSWGKIEKLEKLI